MVAAAAAAADREAAEVILATGITEGTMAAETGEAVAVVAAMVVDREVVAMAEEAAATAEGEEATRDGIRIIWQSGGLPRKKMENGWNIAGGKLGLSCRW